MAAPTIQTMDGLDSLSKYPGIFVKQTKKGCFQELMGCEANVRRPVYFGTCA